MIAYGQWLYKHESQELTWSDELYDIYELDKNTFSPTYQNVINRMHPEDQDFVDKAFQKISTEKMHGDLTHRIITPSHKVKLIREIWTTIYKNQHPDISIGAVYDESCQHYLEAQLQTSQFILIQSFKNTICAMSKALELRDPYTAGHQNNVKDISSLIATKLGLSDQVIEGIELGAQIHDIGKISVPAEILTKPTTLSELEFELIKTHVNAGANIIENIYFPWPLKKIILQHHERLNGTGYPNQLVGTDVCLEAKIVAVADVYDSMHSQRPYRGRLPLETILTEFTENKGILYDTEVVEALLDLIKTKKNIIGFKLRRLKHSSLSLKGKRLF